MIYDGGAEQQFIGVPSPEYRSRIKSALMKINKRRKKKKPTEEKKQKECRKLWCCLFIDSQTVNGKEKDKKRERKIGEKNEFMHSIQQIFAMGYMKRIINDDI